MIGRYRHRLIVETLTKTADGGGGFVSNWMPIGQVRAWVAPVSGAEFLQSQRLSDQITHQISMPYNRLVTPKHRLRWGDRIFNLKSVLNVQERGVELLVMAIEGDAEFPT